VLSLTQEIAVDLESGFTKERPTVTCSMATIRHVPAKSG